jgi:DNA-binding beta-propeller fold protein YncE
LVALVGSTIAFAFPASSSAQTGHDFLSQLPLFLTNPEAQIGAVTVDKSGNVFVADNAAGVVDVFDAFGTYKTQFGAGLLENEIDVVQVTGLAVDTSGKVYVADNATDTVDVFKPNGSGGYTLLSEWTGANTPAKAFGEPAKGLPVLEGVAIDNSTSKADPSAGDVYVVDKALSAVYVFKPHEGPEEAKEGVFVSELKGKPKFEEPNGVAVNSTTGSAYVADNLKGIVEVFNSAGVFESKITSVNTPNKPFGPSAIAVEESTGDVYVVNETLVDQFKSTGEWVGSLAATTGGPLSAPNGVALDNSTSGSDPSKSDVYVSDAQTRAVDVFGPNTVVPAVTTSKAKPMERVIGTGHIAATLNGSINPSGVPAKYHFEYREGQAGPFTSTPLTGAGEGTAAVEVHAVINVKPQTIYEFRLVGDNAGGGVSLGHALQFETLPAVAAVNTSEATGVGTSGATLNGSLAPGKVATQYHFEYGESLAYGSATPTETSSGAAVSATAAVTGLRADTTYHFRITATNEFGTTFGQDQRFTTPGSPTITSISSGPKTHTTEFVKAKIHPNGSVPIKYHVEYGETEAYGTSTPEAEVPVGEEIEVALEKLKLATTYHFRIVAKNTANEEARSPDQEFTTTLIESESAKDLTGEGATLQAQINPLGVETTYHFEYGETQAYGTSVPVLDESVGKESGDKVVQQSITGLHSETTYHYRVVATAQGEGTAAGPDQTFRTGAAGATFKLPDGRAYEMVSPPNKHGGYIVPIRAGGALIQASENGNALTYVVNGPIVEGPEGNRSPEAQQILATRGSTSWSSQDIVTPGERPGEIHGEAQEYEAFSPNLSLAFLQPLPFSFTPLAEPPLTPPLSEAERGHQEKTMYLRENAPIGPEGPETTIYNEARQNGEILAKEHKEPEAKPGYLALVTAANTPAGTKIGGKKLQRGLVGPFLTFLGAAPDLTHVVLQSTVALAREGQSAPGMYEWAGGKLQLVSILPSGAPATVTPQLGAGENTQSLSNTRHAISNDGSRIVWKIPTPTAGHGHLYMRDMTRGETIQLDAPAEGLQALEGEPTFQTASTDGSKLFFTDNQRLTANSQAGPEGGGLQSRPDLYECEVVEVAGKLTCKLRDLTVDKNAGESAAVQGLVLGASEDGSYIYFVADGVLSGTVGATSGGCNNNPRESVPAGTTCNLYMLHETGTEWTTSFIARLSSEDSPDWGIVPNVTQPGTIHLTARVAPAGHYLAFMSDRSLTGYNNTDVNEEAGRHADEEVFLYNADSGGVSCASCNPSGARPRGVFDSFASEGHPLLVDDLQIWDASPSSHIAHWLAGSVPGWTSISNFDSTHQSRYLSDNGRLYFTSADQLVPEAAGDVRKETIVPGKAPASVGVENVYQYEPSGTFGCSNPRGCVALISSGKSERESAFLDATPSGSDVFFLTDAKLLPQDTDTSFDVYDARVCTAGSPCQSPPPPPPPPCVSTEECRSASPTQPSFEAPPSSVFSGPGNSLHAIESHGTLPNKTEKPLTNAQKLAKALKACRKLPKKTHAQRSKRAKCEAQAKKKYGAKRARHSSGGAR